MTEIPSIAFRNGEYVADRTGANALAELLVLFENEMRAAGCTTLAQLRPGVEAETVYDGLAEIGLVPPEELVALWGWHDGLDDRAQPGTVMPSGSLCSLERSVAETKHFRESPLGATLSGTVWHPRWIRLENDRFGFSMECGTVSSSSPKLEYVSEENPLIGERVRPPVRSVCTLVTLWIEQIQQGVVTWDETFWRFHFPKATQLQRAVLLGV